MRFLTVILSMFAVVALAAAEGEGPVAVFSKDETARLAKGQVVVRGEMYTKADGKRAGKGKAFCVINKPPDAVWAILKDYGKIAEYMPRVDNIKVLEHKGSNMKVLQELGVAFTTVRYALDLKFDDTARRMDWTLDKKQKADIADTFGSWEFFAHGEGKTLVRYTVAVDTGQFVPQFVEDYLVKKDLPEVLLAIKRRSESGGTWKKD